MKKYIKLSTIALALSLGFTSCKDYLDKLPDDRAEVNNTEKVTSLLVSAYPTHSANFLLWMSSDNVEDNGKLYTAQPNQIKMYRWENVETEGNDDPRSLWNDCYTRIGSANIALEAIAAQGNPASLNGQKAEALLCRAFAMFTLSNIFCMAYDPTKADKYMGLPYPKVSGTSVDERGTMKELYENINADIEAALPLLDDNHLSVPKFHFNTKAAYAFAARFNLYYHQYDKAIDYATKVLGSNPLDVMRDYTAYVSLSYTDMYHMYVNSGEKANLMLLPAYSMLGRVTRGSANYRRFNHNMKILGYETFWAIAPWSNSNATSGSNTLYLAHRQWGTDQYVFCPTQLEEFEYTDKTGNSGYAHIIDTPFTGDETLLVRAEAYALKGDFTNALADMNTWMSTNCVPALPYSTWSGTKTTPTLTAEYLNDYYSRMSYAEVTPTTDRARTIRKVLHPQGFTVAEGTQESLVQLILHMRRVMNIYNGLRFQDLKRYGIEFTHFVEGEDPRVFKAGDLRGAIQLPNDVINAGLPANPREGDIITNE